MTTTLSQQLALIDQVALVELHGSVREVRGLSVLVAGFAAPIGASVRIETRDSNAKTLDGEVVGFADDQTVVMPLSSTQGVRRGDRVTATQFSQSVSVSDALLGRVLDGMGRPIDGAGPVLNTTRRPLKPPPLDPMDRPMIDQPLATGVRAVDALMSIGRGQRVGIFSPPGVGKSTLLAMMARQTEADVSVIALVGERGREVRDFLDHQLSEEALGRSVVVCATGDEPPLLRIRAAWVAAAIAEHFRDAGKHVLFLMDSITRFCQAQRQVGLSAGEPPATKGYPPSVFAMLPVLVERSGRLRDGSITGLYSVLVEGDELMDPIADAARGVLDGHIALDRDLANRGHWPAIKVLESISRIAEHVTDKQHQRARTEVLRLLGDYAQVEDLLNIGAYAAGSNVDFDLAIACKPAIDTLLQQGMRDVGGKADFDRSRKQLLALSQHIDTARKQLQQGGARSVNGPGSGSERHG